MLIQEKMGKTILNNNPNKVLQEFHNIILYIVRIKVAENENPPLSDTQLGKKMKDAVFIGFIVIVAFDIFIHFLLFIFLFTILIILKI